MFWGDYSEEFRSPISTHCRGDTTSQVTLNFCVFVGVTWRSHVVHGFSNCCMSTTIGKPTIVYW
jgi:hypothetical protein